MKTLLSSDKFDFTSSENKDFIIAFTEEIAKLGYGFGDDIGTGYCWGKYMIIYAKLSVKQKKVAARIYIRENSIVLRLYLNQIDKHRTYIENAPEFIKEVFTGEHGKCHHCHNEKEGLCKFRKSYTIDHTFIEKCNGITFEFWQPDLEKLPDYMGLLRKFYLVGKKGK